MIYLGLFVIFCLALHLYMFKQNVNIDERIPVLTTDYGYNDYWSGKKTLDQIENEYKEAIKQLTYETSK